jgi:hypothetical protein
MNSDSAEAPVETEASSEGVLRKLLGSRIAPKVHRFMVTETAMGFPGSSEGVESDDVADADGDGE